MEYLIPFGALAGLLTISMQSKRGLPAKEGFEALPNTNEPNRIYDPDSVQYPLMDANNVLDRTEKLDHDNLYTGKAYTDKYFNVFNDTNLALNQSQRIVADTNNIERKGAVFTSLMGKPVDESYFAHQNMVPYFGAKIRQRQFDPNSNEAVLDSKMGSGSQQFTKVEQSPLFKPEDNLQWAYGMPNQNDFMQGRVNPSLRMANVKPFEEERVAPGLGLGYTSQGSGGFNSGMMDREAWLPKSVDDLRVANKPKVGGSGVYGYEGPADSMIKSMATMEQMGRQEKHRPERTFEMGSNRLMTTTGAEKGQTMRSAVIERRVARPDTSTEYVGAAHSHGKESLEGEYMPSKRQTLDQVPLGNAGWTNAVGAENDYGVKSHRAYNNNRSSATDYFGALTSVITAAVTPVMDVLRPSRKENTVGNLRLYGDAGTTVPQSYVLNPNDKAPTTLRETTERSKFHMNINANQLGGAYKVSAQQPAFTERATQSDYYYAGGSSAGSQRQQARAYDAEYRQRNNDVKAQTIDGRMVKGNMSLLNNQVNVRAYDRSPGLQQAQVRTPVPNGNRGINNVTPSVDTLGYFSLQNKPNLYQGIQADRNDGSAVRAQLSGNPYALPSFAK